MRISCFKPHTSSLEHRLSVTNLILKPKQICLWSYHQDFFFKLVKAPSKATEDLLQLKTNQLCASRDSFSWCHITKSNRSHTLRKALPSQTGADILCHIILKTHFIQKKQQQNTKKHEPTQSLWLLNKKDYKGIMNKLFSRCCYIMSEM